MEIGKKITSNSPLETAAAAAALAAELAGGEVILLNGRLGAGKTVFAKALIAALGVKKTVQSPTFAIMRVYEGRLTVFHLDMYRISAEEAEEIGADEIFGGDSVVIIEWNRLARLAGRVLAVNIEYVDENARTIEILEQNERKNERACD